MWQYLIKRGLTMVVTFIGITIVVFAILRLAPGDPTQQKVDFGEREQDSSRAQQLIRFKQAHHLDKPLFLNMRPYWNYREEMQFWVDFLTWHAPRRVRYLRDVRGDERNELLTYFERIRLPAPKTALDGRPFEVRQAARSAIWETLLLNLADRDTWMLPILVDEFQSVSEQLRNIDEPVNRFRDRMSELQEQLSKNRDGNAGVFDDQKQAIRQLEEEVGDVRVPAGVASLDPTAHVRVNVLILTAWLEQQRATDEQEASEQLQGAADDLHRSLTDIIQQLSNEDLDQAERDRLRDRAADRVETFRDQHRILDLEADQLLLDPDQSPRFNSSVAGLYAYSVRRRLDVVVRLLNNLTGDAFGATFRLPDRNLSATKREELHSDAENVAFLWTEGWWRQNKQRFEDITPERREELSGIMEELLDESDDFRRRRMIRGQLSSADLPYMIEVLEDPEHSLARRAIASQVLIEFADPPENYRMDVFSSRDDIQSCIQLWERWWTQNRSDYQFTTLERIGYTFAQTQYSLYMWNLARLNFGETMSSPVEPVYDRLKRAIWRTGPLMLLATLFTYLMAIPLGVICAVTQRSLTDRGISVSLLVLWAIPGYAAAMILIYLFANPGDGGLIQMFPARGLARYDQILWHLFWAFTGGGKEALGFTGHLSSFFSGTMNYLYHAFLPMFSTSVFGMASLALYSRVSMLEVIRKDYIRTARAKGLSEFSVIGKHVVRNGLNPIITLFANLLPRIVGGSLIIEIIFEIQGVGKMFFEAAQARDYNVMMCFLLITAVLVMVGILISDLLYVVVNPRLDFDEVET
jgi:ABC-type dipeptide/oligopeptide/nickel transport system permease component